MKKYILLLTVGMVLAQWLVPAHIIGVQEDTLAKGIPYKFKTQPIDPADPFRGKYVTLYFDNSGFETDTLTEYDAGEKLNVALGKDSAGFAMIKGISREEPVGEIYLTAQVSYTSPDSKTPSRNIVYFDFPFSEYYVEESKAPKAEKAYRDANIRKKQVAYALVKVKDGNSALQDVIIDGQSLIEVVRKLNADAIQKR
jgi:uncharacterized membrane-anchored protein